MFLLKFGSIVIPNYSLKWSLFCTNIVFCEMCPDLVKEIVLPRLVILSGLMTNRILNAVLQQIAILELQFHLMWPLIEEALFSAITALYKWWG